MIMFSPFPIDALSVLSSQFIPTRYLDGQYDIYFNEEMFQKKKSQQLLCMYIKSLFRFPHFAFVSTGESLFFFSV